MMELLVRRIMQLQKLMNVVCKNGEYALLNDIEVIKINYFELKNIDIFLKVLNIR